LRRVLVACEYSATVRDKFRSLGFDAWSCDLRPCDGDPRFHIQGDVRGGVLEMGWDLLVGHPYCTFNTLAGIRWFYHPEDTHLPASARRRHPNYPDRMEKFREGIDLFKLLRDAPIPHIALENSKPHGLAMAEIGRPHQTVQPYMFGEPYTKGASLWLKDLPPLVPWSRKEDFEEIIARCHLMAPGPEREKERSRTYDGIATAMAEQWGAYITKGDSIDSKNWRSTGHGLPDLLSDVRKRDGNGLGHRYLDLGM